MRNIFYGLEVFLPDTRVLFDLNVKELGLVGYANFEVCSSDVSVPRYDQFAVVYGNIDRLLLGIFLQVYFLN